MNRVEAAAQHADAHCPRPCFPNECLDRPYLSPGPLAGQWKTCWLPGLLAAALVVVTASHLEGQEKSAPEPESEPQLVSPLAPTGQPVRQARPATVVFSNSRKLVGQVWLTPGKRLKVFERAQEKYREFSLQDVLRIDVDPEKEKMEPVWRWREHASDEKVYTGETYPWREYVTTLVVLDRRGKRLTVVGDVTALLYFQADPKKKPVRLIIHRRDKGEVGQTLHDLVYVTAVVFEEEKQATLVSSVRTDCPRGASLRTAPGASRKRQCLKDEQS